MPPKPRQVRIESKSALAAMQKLETRSDEELESETKFKAAALAILGYALGANWEHVANDFHGPTYAIAGVLVVGIVVVIVRRRRHTKAAATGGGYRTDGQVNSMGGGQAPMGVASGRPTGPAQPPAGRYAPAPQDAWAAPPASYEPDPTGRYR